MGLSFRVIARLDVKGENLIKGVRFEGLRVLGRPAEFAKRYADDGADELLYIDTVASLYGRNQLQGLLRETTQEAFIPITVAGGIGSLEAVRELLNAGADRVAINTAAIRNPRLVSEIAERYGCQAVTVSIEAKRASDGWEAMTDCGREHSGKDALEWAREAATLGAGELLITSIDRDGTRSGFDAELLERIEVDIPVIAAGGLGKPEHLDAIGYCDAVAIGAALHYRDLTISDVKDELRFLGKEVR